MQRTFAFLLSFLALCVSNAYAGSIERNQKEIYDDSRSPVMGNPSGTKTIVEFFDYTCSHCKTNFKAVKAQLADKDVKVIMKEFPILGPNAVTAASAAIAAKNQGKYPEMHTKLMQHQGEITLAVVKDIAKKIGLNLSKFKEDIANPKTKDQLEDNMKLGMDLKIYGTPSFIINGIVYRGSLNEEELKNYLQIRKPQATSSEVSFPEEERPIRTASL